MPESKLGKCPAPKYLLAYATGRLTAEAEEIVGDHVSSCAVCQQVIAGLKSVESLAPKDKPGTATSGQTPEAKRRSPWPTVMAATVALGIVGAVGYWALNRFAAPLDAPAGRQRTATASSPVPSPTTVGRPSLGFRNGNLAPETPIESLRVTIYLGSDGEPADRAARFASWLRISDSPTLTSERRGQRIVRCVPSDVVS